jgi:pimeloyl-ACP methyl ester carboxylesterase
MATDRRFTGGATGRSADETGRPGDPSAGPDGPDRPAEEGVGSVRVDGRRLAYATYGDPDGRPVLVHHGSPGSRLVGQLLDGAARERGLRLVAPDRPGFGRSTHDPDRTIPDWPGDAAAVLDALGIERASVVGFSGGGPFALAVAAAYPDRV